MGEVVKLGKEKKQNVDITDIIKNPSAKARLQNYIDEAVMHRMRIAQTNSVIKGVKQAAVDDLGINPKLFMALCRCFFSNNFDEKREEMDQLGVAIESLMQTNNKIPIDVEEEDEET